MQVRCDRLLYRCRSNPASLLTIIYGLYCLETVSSGDIYAIVMANVFPPPNGPIVSEVYDLKGSTYHRDAAKKDATPGYTLMRVTTAVKWKFQLLSWHV